MKKFIYIVLSVLLILCVLSGCSAQSNSNSDASDNSTVSENEIVTEVTNIETTTELTTELTTEPKQLSEDCDFILARGYDGDDYYELVANETENYSGVNIEIGVIKNNKWLKELTSDIPFIGSNGALKNGKSIELSTQYFHYLGKGTFIFSYDVKYSNGVIDYTIDIVYNAKKDLSYAKNEEHKSFVKYEDYFTEELVFINPNCEYVILNVIKYQDEYKLTLLNFETMNEKDIKISREGFKIDTDQLYPISDGIIAVVGADHLRFVDTAGKITYDGDFNFAHHIYPDEAFLMKGGKCSFEVENNNGSVYRITIDKKGNIINEEKI